MISYIFSSGESLSIEKCQSLGELSENFSELYNVVLESESELEILLHLIGLKPPEKVYLDGNPDFEFLYDVSSQNMKEFTKESFDGFYEQWIKQTRRESSMDEYGQLIFLVGQPNSWNQRPYKVILHERA